MLYNNACMADYESIARRVSIRGEHDGFANEREQYLVALDRAKSNSVDPPGDRIPWPLDMSNPNLHITAYYADNNYSGKGGGEHRALDIQAPLGTAVILPISGRIVSVEGLNPRGLNHRRGLVDVTILDPQASLLYRFAHLESGSLPAGLTKDFFSMDSNISFEAGTTIGTVGEFFSDYMKGLGLSGLSEEVEVPPDVAEVYGRSYDHLHFDTARLPISRAFYPEYFDGYTIDPLPRLQQLYSG
jgi:hypothetical protein